MESSSTLFVATDDQEINLNSAESLTIGRGSDLNLGGSDTAMHRHAATLWYRGGAWWLTNHAQQFEFVITEVGGRSFVQCGPQRSAAMSFGDHDVRCMPSAKEYRFGATCDLLVPPGQEPDLAGADTTRWGHVPLGEVERLVLVALAEPWLIDPGFDGQPISNKACQRRLGISPNSFNHALDRICNKLDALGIEGVRGDVAKLATNRRQRLIEHGLRCELVTAADLVSLPPVRD